MRALREFLRPEFINRVDEIITFNHLSEENFRGIAGIMLKELSGCLADRGLTICWTENVIDLLVKNPRERFGIPMTLDFSVWDLEESYAVDPAQFLSLGKATPFQGWQVNGKCLLTVCDGKVVYQAE